MRSELREEAGIFVVGGGVTEAALAEEGPPARGLTNWLDAQGTLRRERPDDGRVAWSQIPVSLQAAADRLAQCEPRERAVLDALAAQRYLTLDQITRGFYKAERTARTQLYRLLTERLVCRLDRLPWMGRAVGYTRRPPWVYFLDWNGFLALDGPEPGAPRPRGRPRRRLGWWEAERVAQPSAAVAHQLGVNEVWSHLWAAARYTQQRSGNGEAGAPLAMQLGWRNEGDALVRYGTGPRQVLRPDAEIRIRLSGADAPRVGMCGAPLEPVDWEQAALEERSWRVPLEGEGSGEPGVGRDLTLLLEFESGAHHEGARIAQVQGYNTLFQTAQTTWQSRYGVRIPRVLAVVREDRQIIDLVAIWRMHYFMAQHMKPGSQACPVLVTSLPALKRAEQQAAAGVLGRCWVHALDPAAHPRGVPGPGPQIPCRTLTLGEALGAPGL